jgi:hypothetical protein
VADGTIVNHLLRVIDAQELKRRNKHLMYRRGWRLACWKLKPKATMPPPVSDSYDHHDMEVSFHFEEGQSETPDFTTTANPLVSHGLADDNMDVSFNYEESSTENPCTILPKAKFAILLLGMVQMEYIQCLSLDSTVSMVTPRQGRDMARILFTKLRSGKNIYSLDLIG